MSARSLVSSHCLAPLSGLVSRSPIIHRMNGAGRHPALDAGWPPPTQQAFSAGRSASASRRWIEKILVSIHPTKPVPGAAPGTQLPGRLFRGPPTERSRPSRGLPESTLPRSFPIHGNRRVKMDPGTHCCEDRSRFRRARDFNCYRNFGRTFAMSSVGASDGDRHRDTGPGIDSGYDQTRRNCNQSPCCVAVSGGVSRPSRRRRIVRARSRAAVDFDTKASAPTNRAVVGVSCMLKNTILVEGEA